MQVIMRSVFARFVEQVNICICALMDCMSIVMPIRTGEELWPRFEADLGYSCRAVKFVFDILVTALGTVFIFPVFLLLCVCVAIENKGRIFFVHKRVGKNGKLFPCYKFQTMVKDSDLVLQDYLQNNPQAQKEWAANFKLTDDPRVTRLGRILRKTSLDELPQIFNVLKGEMSLVGPRPIVPAEIKKYGKYIREYYMVRPGITGVWQTNGRSDTTYQERVAMDTWYVRNWSIWLDLKCLAKTVSAVIKKKGAY